MDAMAITVEKFTELGFTTEEIAQMFDLNSNIEPPATENRLDYITRALLNGDSRKSIAEHLGISPSRVSELIKQHKLHG